MPLFGVKSETSQDSSSKRIKSVCVLDCLRSVRRVVPYRPRVVAVHVQMQSPVGTHFITVDSSLMPFWVMGSPPGLSIV